MAELRAARERSTNPKSLLLHFPQGDLPRDKPPH
jgi:hypothetical protein